MSTTDAVCNLRAALTRMGGNIKLLRATIEFYREDSPQLLGDLRRAVSAQDSPKVRQAAHALKGLLVNFDAGTAARAAFELERLAADGDLSTAPAEVATLEEEMNRLSLRLDGELANLEVSS